MKLTLREARLLVREMLDCDDLTRNPTSPAMAEREQLEDLTLGASDDNAGWNDEPDGDQPPKVAKRAPAVRLDPYVNDPDRGNTTSFLPR